MSRNHEVTVMSVPRARTESRTMMSETILANRYALRKKLGSGGMAHVYLAWDIELEREVAVKMLRVELENDPAEIERFRGEARMLARVESARVGQIYDVHMGPDLHYLVLRRFTGTTLDKTVAPTPWAPNAALDLAASVLGGLADLHAQHIVHRDIKPANVMIGDDGSAILLDLGVAIDARQPQNTEITSGTPAWMSPEQRETGVADARSDIYQVGLLLFFAATGLDPALCEVSALATALPPKLATVIGRAIVRDPARRFQSAQEMIGAIRREARGTIAVEPRDVISERKLMSLHAKAGFGMAAVAAAVFGAAMWYPQTQSADSVAMLDVDDAPSHEGVVRRVAHDEAPPPMTDDVIVMEPDHVARTVVAKPAPRGHAVEIAPSRRLEHAVPQTANDFLHAASRDEQNGATEAAIAGYRQYLRLDPDAPEIRAHLTVLESGR